MVDDCISTKERTFGKLGLQKRGSHAGKVTHTVF